MIRWHIMSGASGLEFASSEERCVTNNAVEVKMSNDVTLSAGSPRKFYFMLTFWGEKFTEHFYSLLLPTLLAPNNIPILKRRPGSKLIICTTTADWDALKGRRLMRELVEYVEALPIFIDYPGANAAIQLHMSRAHQMAARRARQDRAVAGFLAPDLLCSDGLIKTAVELIESGKTVVVCPALRFSMETALKRISDAGFLQPETVAALPAHLMGSVAANALHPEILRYNFQGREFDDYPIWSFWRVPKRDGLILYTVSWALLLGDYAAIPDFTDESLNESTIDGDYVWRNFGHLRETDQVALLNDSSQGTFISLTPENEFDFTLCNARARRLNSFLRFFAVAKRSHDIHRFYNLPDLDPWRRWLYSTPIILHGDPIDSNYEKCISRTKAVMMDAFNGATERRHRVLMKIIDFTTITAVHLISHWSFRIFHLARRGLHVASLGRIYYPGSSGRNLRAALRPVKNDVVYLLRRVIRMLSFGRVCSAGSPQQGTSQAPN
jgi:hypothetical protein